MHVSVFEAVRMSPSAHEDQGILQFSVGWKASSDLKQSCPVVFRRNESAPATLVVRWEDVSSDRIRVVLQSVADGRAR